MTCPRCDNTMAAEAKPCRGWHAWRWLRRGAGVAMPSALLVLLPKCPACLVGYVALLTGLGISLSAAAYLRTGLIVLCVGLIALLVFRSVYRLVKY